MNIDEAKRHARLVVDEFARRASAELALDHELGIGERSWCYIFVFNNLTYVATRVFETMRVGQGPIVIPKDGSEFPHLGSGHDPDIYLREYEVRHGIPAGDEVDHEMPPEPAVVRYWHEHPGTGPDNSVR